MKKLLLLGVVLFLAGCVTSYDLKKTGDAKLWSAYSVSNQETLNETKSEKVIVWTKYGPILEAIQFWKPVEDGQLLPLNSSVESDKRQRYQSDMTISEIVEIYREDLTGTGKIVISMTEPETVSFGGKEAYRVQSILSDKNGYDFKNELILSVIDDKLYMIELTSAAVHYFDERKKTFDKVIQSIKI